MVVACLSTWVRNRTKSTINYPLLALEKMSNFIKCQPSTNCSYHYDLNISSKLLLLIPILCRCTNYLGLYNKHYFFHDSQISYYQVFSMPSRFGLPWEIHSSADCPLLWQNSVVTMSCHCCDVSFLATSKWTPKSYWLNYHYIFILIITTRDNIVLESLNFLMYDFYVLYGF